MIKRYIQRHDYQNYPSSKRSLLRMQGICMYNTSFIARLIIFYSLVLSYKNTLNLHSVSFFYLLPRGRSVRTEFISLDLVKLLLKPMNRTIACAALSRPRNQCSPVPTHLDHADASLGMFLEHVIMQSPGIHRCIISMAYHCLS